MIMNVSINESSTGLNLSNTVHVAVDASPTPLRVEYYLDNVLMYAPSTLALVWAWDTTKETNGTHTVRVEAVYKSRRSKAQIVVTTSNRATTSPVFGQSSFSSTSFLRRVAGFFGRAPKNI